MDLVNSIELIIYSCSILILSYGMLLFFKVKKRRTIDFYVISLFALELSSIIKGYFLGTSNLELFVIFSLANFIFLTYFYMNRFGYNGRRKIILLGSLPFLVCVLPGFDIQLAISYGRFLYSLVFVLYSLLYFLVFLKKEIHTSKPELAFNGSVLIFFTVDAFLALGTNYLVQEKQLVLVTGFWFFRAFCLQALYISLINYTWKSYKVSTIS